MGQSFSKEFKQAAVAKAEASGNISQTARELGLSSKSLNRWVNEARKEREFDIEGASAKELAKRVQELEKQLRVREQQMEILKKAISIVSQENESGSG